MFRKFGIKKQGRKKYSIALAVVGMAVLAGAFFIFISRAATPFVALESENGSMTNGARKVSDATASGGAATLFRAPSTAFAHPGVYMNKAQLDFVKGKIAANEQPWAAGYGAFYGWARGAAPESGTGITYVGWPTTD